VIRLEDVVREEDPGGLLEALALEMPGLSKTNWNTFDLYGQFPATIASSNDIARIGAMLYRFSGSSYDYRLLM